MGAKWLFCTPVCITSSYWPGPFSTCFHPSALSFLGRAVATSGTQVWTLYFPSIKLTLVQSFYFVHLNISYSFFARWLLWIWSKSNLLSGLVRKFYDFSCRILGVSLINKSKIKCNLLYFTQWILLQEENPGPFWWNWSTWQCALGPGSLSNSCVGTVLLLCVEWSEDHRKGAAESER